MLSALSGVLFAVAPVLQTDAAAELQVAVQKLAQAEGIQFVVRAESSGNQGGSSGSSGIGGYTEASGVSKKGLPLQLTQDEVVAFKQGDTIVHKDKAGQWKVLEMPPGLGAGAERPSERPSERKAKTVSSFGAMDDSIALVGLTWIQSPATVFADFASKVEDVQKSTADGASVFTGNLTAKAAEGLAPPDRNAPERGAGSGSAPAADVLAASGTYSVTVKDGAVVAAEFQVARAVKSGDRSSVATRVHAYRFEKVGDVELEVPPQVLELLK